MICTRIAAMLIILIVLAGCQTETAPDAEAEQTSTAAQAEEEPIFEEALEDAKCTLLTMEDVAAATGVPASAIEKYSGCLYTWDEGSDWEDGTVYLFSLRVYDTVEQAQRAHARETQDVTATEVAQAKEEVQNDLAEQRSEGEITSSEEALASTMTDAMPEMDFTHRALSGVGSEAVMDNRGSVYIRLGNAIIEFSGKTDGEDYLDPARAEAVGRRIVANIKAL